MTLFESINLAGQNLLASLSQTKNEMPFFVQVLNTDYTAMFRTYWEEHNVGRWWDAMLRLEACTGFVIPPKTEAHMLENFFHFFDNEDHLCLQPVEEYRGDEMQQCTMHSLRESLLGLTALVKYRNNRYAAELGHKMLLTVERMLCDDGRMDVTILAYNQKLKPRGLTMRCDASNAHTNGRMIEALVWFFQATGDDLAFRLADKLARIHYERSTMPDGTINMAMNPNHTHSYLGMLRGLLLYGMMTHQQAYIDRIAAMYRVTVRGKIVKDSGFAPHGIWEDGGGETAAPGDAAQLALWLWQAGHTEFIDDAEKFVRCRILPSQILETPPLTPCETDNPEAVRDISARIIGAYGGCYMYPHAGKQGATDVTASDIHTIVDIYRHCIIETDEFIRVMFHFDYEDDRISIAGHRADQAKLAITLMKRKPLLIRLPLWAKPEDAVLTVDGAVEPMIMVGQFVYVSATQPGNSIVLTYPLPERIIEETTAGITYRIKFKGDEIIGVSPNNDFYPFYPTLKE